MQIWKPLCGIVGQPENYSDILKTIKDKKDFEELIQNSGLVICFVHSPWSGTSMPGLKVFKDLLLSKPEFTYILIDNESADSFIYDWLKNQEQIFEPNNINLKRRVGSWIHGNGEIFGVINGHLIWFEHSINGQTIKDIEKKGYFEK